MQPHRWQPTRLHHRRDSPSKNTGVGCHFLLQCMHACYVISIVSNSVRPHRWQPTGSSVPGILQARILEWAAISFSNACMHAKSLQSCPTLSNPMNCGLPGSSVHGIFQARVLEWVAIAFSASSPRQPLIYFLGLDILCKWNDTEWSFVPGPILSRFIHV